eukprot:Sspe_Gene.77883::Locus_48696_Transcript_2_2_Confidence_0.667_Length_1175::g.77883::m.77883
MGHVAGRRRSVPLSKHEDTDLDLVASVVGRATKHLVAGGSTVPPPDFFENFVEYYTQRSPGQGQRPHSSEAPSEEGALMALILEKGYENGPSHRSQSLET